MSGCHWFGSRAVAFKNAAHLLCLVVRLLQHEIEKNPGPVNSRGVRCASLTAVTLNCRGLGDMDKTRLLLNKVYQLPMISP
jgi:hypothetical protein